MKEDRYQKNNLLIIGQTPPPYHGQSIMIEKIVTGNPKNLKIYFFRMRFSEKIDEVGSFSIKKLFRLLTLIKSINKVIKNKNIDVVYYPPTGNSKNALYRDLFLLFWIRKNNLKVAFHFHAMGLQVNYENANRLIKWMFRKVFLKPDLCICLSEYNIPDIQFLEPKNIEVIPYGVEDVSKREYKNKSSSETINILFTGNIIPSKGVFVLLNVLNNIDQKKYNVRAFFMGGMRSSEIEKDINDHPVVKKNIAKFLGVCIDKKKDLYFKKADIFCFPTFYENENFPVVLLEAMSYGLPIVTTHWRGIPSMITNGVNGFMAEPKSEKDFQIYLEKLLNDYTLRESMSKMARRKYEEEFTEEVYKKNIYRALSKLK